MIILTLVLPWPDKALSPNSRSTWAKIKAVTAARNLAYQLTIPEECQFIQPPGPLSVTYTFNPPTKRRQDLDNMLARCKAYQDGIFTSLNWDDTLIVELHARRGEVIKGGQVMIAISQIP